MSSVQTNFVFNYSQIISCWIMFCLSFSPIWRQYTIVITVNLCVLVTGLGVAWPSPVLVKLRDESQTVLSRPMTEEEGSWIVSIGFLTGVLSNFLVAYLVDKIGRKYCIILSCIPKILVGFLMIFANDVWMLLVARAVVGISDTFVFSIVPMYTSEVASKEIRGALGTIFQIFCSLGVVIMLSAGPFITYVNLSILYTCFMIATSVPLVFLPDSPYFLYSKGHDKTALEVLMFLRGTETFALEELKQYTLVAKKEKMNKKKLFKNRIFLKSFLYVLVLCAGVQVIGFNSVTFYLQTILVSTQTSVKPEVASAILGFIQLGSCFCTVFVTDRVGRKPIMVTTLIITAIGMIGLGTFFKLKENCTISGVLNYLPIISLILIVFGYSAGIGSVTWALNPELFDDSSRGVGLSMSHIMSYICLFSTSKYFALLTSVIGPSATYWMFSFNCILFMLFILFCIPETKGKSFSEIQVALGAKRVAPEEKYDTRSI